MVPLCNMVTLWASNTRTRTTVPGCTTTEATSVHEAVALTANHHALQKTPPLVSRSSKSCEALTSSTVFCCEL